MSMTKVSKKDIGAPIIAILYLEGVNGYRFWNGIEVRKRKKVKRKRNKLMRMGKTLGKILIKTG